MIVEYIIARNVFWYKTNNPKSTENVINWDMIFKKEYTLPLMSILICSNKNLFNNKAGIKKQNAIIKPVSTEPNKKLDIGFKNIKQIEIRTAQIMSG